MFVGYENFSTYFVDGDELEVLPPENASSEGSAGLPLEFSPKFPTPYPWFQNSASSKDFLVVAEFSELEGPVPRLTIPACETFQEFSLDSFVVRLMSVDHQLAQGVEFSISEDAHVVLSQSEHGLYAHVHHFTLYDSIARGFVRPFCVAYVTPDYNKLVNFYSELKAEFSKASHVFKAGNYLAFFNDMTHRLSDLQYTKERCLEAECLPDKMPTDGKIGNTQRSPSLAELDQSILEIRHILKTVSDQIKSPTAGYSMPQVKPHETPVDTKNFNYTLKILQNKHLELIFDDDSSFAEVSHSYQPQLLKSLKRTIPKQLRTLDELCPQSTEGGLAILNNIYMYFKRDSVTLLLEREDIACLDPSCSLLTIGRSVYLNLSAGINVPDAGCSGCSLNSPHSYSVICSPSVNCAGIFPSSSMNSFYSCDSNDSFSSCISDLERLGMDTSSKSLSVSHSAGDDVNCGDLSVCDVPVILTENLDDQIGESFARRPDTLQLSTPSCGSQLNKTSVITVADHVENLNENSLGFGLLYFVHQFPVSTHILFSLLIGRPVIVLGSLFSEKQIRAVVNALWTFVPGHISQLSTVVPWSTAPLSVSEFGHVKLCGLGLSEGESSKSVISQDLEKFVTILDLDTKSLHSPEYSGHILREIINKKDHFTSDGAYIAYIHCQLFELVRKSFIHYHTLKNSTDKPNCAGDSLINCEASSASGSQLKLSRDDLLIVKYFVDMIKKQQSLETSHDCSPSSSQSESNASHLPCRHFIFR